MNSYLESNRTGSKPIQTAFATRALFDVFCVCRARSVEIVNFVGCCLLRTINRADTIKINKQINAHHSKLKLLLKARVVSMDETKKSIRTHVGHFILTSSLLTPDPSVLLITSIAHEMRASRERRKRRNGPADYINKYAIDSILGLAFVWPITIIKERRTEQRTLEHFHFRQTICLVLTLAPVIQWPERQHFVKKTMNRVSCLTNIFRFRLKTERSSTICGKYYLSLVCTWRHFNWEKRKRIDGEKRRSEFYLMFACVCVSARECVRLCLRSLSCLGLHAVALYLRLEDVRIGNWRRKSCMNLSLFEQKEAKQCRNKLRKSGGNVFLETQWYVARVPDTAVRITWNNLRNESCARNYTITIEAIMLRGVKASCSPLPVGTCCLRVWQPTQRSR